jgi:hypothetical protein
MKNLSERLLAFGVSKDLAQRFDERFANRQIDEKTWKHWTECVDASDYGWPEWVESVLVLDDHVSGLELKSTPVLRRLIGYVGCAAEGAGTGGYLNPLPEIVGEAFDAYGFSEEN